LKDQDENKDCFTVELYIKRTLKRLFKFAGFDLASHNFSGSLSEDAINFDESTTQIISKVKSFTMTSPERLAALIEAVRYISHNQIPGDIVECGVWKGGSMMAAAYTLLESHDQTRHLYLFDTFEGMTQPSDKDISFDGVEASKLLDSSKKSDESSVWCYAPLKVVEESISSVGYNSSKIHMIKGRVEDTIPNNAPSEIALLRLDTDWYESTCHELVHLFPRLATGGVIIIDDYGHWKGARQAVEEYLKEHQICLLLNRIDYTGRIGVKIFASDRLS
jgi:hypothetical protein